MCKIKFYLIKDDQFNFTPVRATSGAKGYDVFAARDTMLMPMGEVELVSIGIKIEICNCETLVQIVPRSNVGKRAIIIPNAPATLDSDYRGEVMVELYNIGNRWQSIKKGDRIAQIVSPNAIEWIEVDSESDLSKTERGIGGFGSTGK